MNRNDGKPFMIMEGEYYLWFDIFHGYVYGIHQTKDPDFASHFLTIEDAASFVKTISYPWRINGYRIVRKWCVWVSDDVFDCTMYPEEIIAESEKDAQNIFYGKLTGEYVVGVEPMENVDNDQSIFAS